MHYEKRASHSGGSFGGFFAAGVFCLFFFYGLEKDVFSIRNCVCYAALFKGNVQVRRLERFKVREAAADVAKGEVILKGFLFVLRIALFELHGSHGSKGVVYIIERIEENVNLVVPIAAALHEGVVFIFAPGHIFFLKLVPLHGALLGGKIRIFVNNVLEFVNRYAEWHKGKSFLKVGKAVFIRSVAKETFCIRIAELFHRHGVNFSNIGTFGIICHNRLMTHCAIACKGMAKLVA